MANKKQDTIIPLGNIPETYEMPPANTDEGMSKDAIAQLRESYKNAIYSCKRNISKIIVDRIRLSKPKLEKKQNKLERTNRRQKKKITKKLNRYIKLNKTVQYPPSIQLHYLWISGIISSFKS